MAIRNDFTAGEVLAAADLNDTFAAKAALASPTFTGTPAAPTAAGGTNTTQLATTAFVLANGGGKILQIVRATNAALFTTSSTSFVDVTGITVTITPTKNTSAILLIASLNMSSDGGADNLSRAQIADSSNNAISGAEGTQVGGGGSAQFFDSVTLLGYATPATTSAVTFKVRARFSGDGAGNARVRGDVITNQLYAIEVSA